MPAVVKLQKIPVDGGFTCPNRDGTLGTGGCSFCNPRAFAPSYCREERSITAQIEAGKRFFTNKQRQGQRVAYHAYFQSYSGTYAPVSVLERRYREALSVTDVTGLVIGTRPDCIADEALALLAQLKAEGHAVKVELGIESCYDKTLLRVGRGHDWACAMDAIQRLARHEVAVGVHLILGLPGETREEMLHEADILSALPIQSLKLHQLQVMKDTPMADEWRLHPEDFWLPAADDYARFVAAFASRLRPGIELERFAAQSPSTLVLAPRWGLKPQEVQRMVESYLTNETINNNL